MKNPKEKSITELRNSLFETFEDVVSGQNHIITHKNGSSVAIVSTDEINSLKSEIELHKKLSIGYAQALRGEGISSLTLKKKLKDKEKALREKHG